LPFSLTDDLGTDEEDVSLLRDHHDRSARDDDFFSSEAATLDGESGNPDDNPEALVAKQYMSNMLSSFLSLGSSKKYQSIFDDGRVDTPDNLILRSTFTVHTRKWITNAYHLFMSWPMRVKLTSCLIMVIYGILTLATESIVAKFSIIANADASNTDPSADASMISNAPYKFLENHQYLPHTFSSLIPHLVAWILTCPLYALVFQYITKPQAFEMNSMADVSLPATSCMLAGASAPFCSAYRFALNKLWLRSIPVFIAVNVPFVLIRLFFVGWVYAIAQNSTVLFGMLFLVFTTLSVYLSMQFAFVLPLFVDHPKYPLHVYLLTSHHLFLRNQSGIALFSVVSALIVIAGTLCLGIGACPAYVIMHIAFAFAYKDILGISSWRTSGAFQWQKQTPGLLGLSCDADALYHSNNLDAVVGADIEYGDGVGASGNDNGNNYRNSEVSFSDMDDDNSATGHISYGYSKSSGDGGVYSNEEGTGVKFQDDLLDL
jgi:hypothetical protein